MLWVANSPYFRRENLQNLLAPSPSHARVQPNKDKVFEAAVFLYNTNGEHSERAKLAANLFCKSLGTNAIVADVKLDNDTLHVKLVRLFRPLKLKDFQWIKVSKQGYSVTPPTHKLETFTQELDSQLSVEEFGLEVRAMMLSDKYNTIHAHKWVPTQRKIKLVTAKHPLLQMR